MMNSLKKIELEYEGIRNTILSYTSQGNISSFLNGLEEGIKKNDMEAIRYYIDEICKWYDDNINEIQANEFVLDYSAHDRNRKILKDLLIELNRNNIEKDEEYMYSKIFLSHSSSDKKYGDALQKLITGIGIKKEQLIYTSHPLHKIPTGNNIYDYLKSNINKNIFVIFLWSNEYLKSSACLNEMGAAWISESDYINIYTPDFDFNNPQYHNCAVDTKSMGIVLKNEGQCKSGIVELKNKFVQGFGLDVDEQAWMYYLDEFIKNIS